MMRFIPLAALLAMPSLAAASSGTPCPKQWGPGEMFPWESEEIMPGDQWANLRLDIDEKGRATGCRIEATNIHSANTKYAVCYSFKKNWYTDPILENGKPVAKTVRTQFIIRGSKHEKREEKARQQFFRDNPGERRECYPNHR
jgi:hypothetical protein